MKPLAALLVIVVLIMPDVTADADAYKIKSVQLGPRPFYLVDQLSDGRLKRDLQRCASRKSKYRASDFSIAHRGAALQFPEHTKESYVAAARMGAGILECDVTFTRDKALVCRHAQCDLHTTTNIVATELAKKCTVPPAFDTEGNLGNAGTIKCCTSDITVGVQIADGQDGRRRQRRNHCRGLSRRYSGFSHRPVRHRGHAADTRREH